MILSGSTPNSTAKISAVSIALKAGLVIIVTGDFSISMSFLAISLEMIFPFRVRDFRSQRFLRMDLLLFHA